MSRRPLTHAEARPRLLDLFCREGGAGEGYRLAGFDVVGVDIEPFDYHPGNFVQADALDFLRSHAAGFDAVHASPPCQRFSNRGKSARVRDQHARPDLITPLRPMLEALGKPWAIENVPGAAKLGIMRVDVTLCGSMFGLPLRRHRVFELGGGARWTRALPPCDHTGQIVGVYGHPHGKRGAWPGMLPSTLETWRAAMGMPWASAKGCAEAIPPAYTQAIGSALMAAVLESRRPPIPAHQDCPACPSCASPCGTASETRAPTLSCCACGHEWTGSPAEVRQAQRADAAYEAKLELEAATARWPEHLREANARMLERASRLPAPVEQLGLFGVSP